jgi:hypothetical protein
VLAGTEKVYLDGAAAKEEDQDMSSTTIPQN